jgi:hypothetical protein
MSADWVPGAVVAAFMSGVGALLSWRVASSKREGTEDSELSRLDKEDTGLRGEIRDLRADLRANSAALQKVSDLAIALQSRQDVVNVMNAKTLEAITNKQDAQGGMLASHAATLRYIEAEMGKAQGNGGGVR